MVKRSIQSGVRHKEKSTYLQKLTCSCSREDFFACVKITAFQRIVMTEFLWLHASGFKIISVKDKATRGACILHIHRENEKWSILCSEQQQEDSGYKNWRDPCWNVFWSEWFHWKNFKLCISEVTVLQKKYHCSKSWYESCISWDLFWNDTTMSLSQWNLGILQVLQE